MVTVSYPLKGARETISIREENSGTVPTSSVPVNGRGVQPPFVPSVLTTGDVDYLRRCVCVVVDICRLYGFDTDGYRLKGTMDHWIRCADVFGDSLKFVKWKIASFYAANMSTSENPLDIPPSVLLDQGLDNPAVLLSGKGYKWLGVLRRTDPDLFSSFLTSILYSKKGMPRPDKDRIARAEKAAFVKLTTWRPDTTLAWDHTRMYARSWADVDSLVEKFPDRKLPEYMLTRGSLSDCIRQTVCELFPDVYDSELDYKPRFPSTSSNYINSRSGGGAVGTILTHKNLLSNLRTTEPTISVEIEEGKGKRGHIRANADMSELDMRYRVLTDRIREEAVVSEQPIAVPLGLPEALKVRVITKGPPLLMTRLKPLQKWMWSYLRKSPALRLVGMPVTPEYVQERMGKSLFPGEKFLSVDYSDATNEIHSWCSEVAADELGRVCKLSAEDLQCLKTSLTGHTLEYDDEQLRQETGQLMGSVTSFVFLCIINAAICRWTQEIAFDRKLTLSDSRIAINGDDAILRTTLFGSRIWQDIAAIAGMSPSIGKVYFSDRFLNLNSTTYYYYPEGWEGYVTKRPDGAKAYRIRHFRLIQYVNAGLLNGLTRSGDSEGVSQNTLRSSVGSRATQLINDCPPALRERVLGEFIHRNSAILKQFSLPWFIPEQLGGLGLPTVGRFNPRSLDLRLARRIFENPSEFPLVSLPRDAPWQVWNLAKKSLKLPDPLSLLLSLELNATVGQISFNQLWGHACVSLLFDDRISFRRLMKKTTQKSKDLNDQLASAAYGKLSRAWQDALSSKKTKSFLPFPRHPDGSGMFPLFHDLYDLPLIGVRDNVFKPYASLTTSQVLSSYTHTLES